MSTSTPDHGSTVTPIKSAPWEAVQGMRAQQEEQGGEYPPPPGANARTHARQAGGRSAVALLRAP